MNNATYPVLTTAYAPFILRASHTRKHIAAPMTYPHPYRCWTLLLVEEGVLHVANRLTIQSIPEGRMLLLPPAAQGELKPHTHLWVRSLEFDLLFRERTRTQNQGWKPRDPGPFRQGFHYLFGKSAPRILPEGLCEQLRPLHRQITNRWWHSDLDAFQANSLLVVMMSRLLEWHLGDRSHSDDLHPLRTAEQVAQRGFTNGCTVRDMARAAGMSRESFTQAYKEWRNQSPGTYLRDLRYKRARVLLREPGLSIEKVANQSGFRSLRTFCRSFQKREGMPPALYRQQHRIKGTG